MTDTTQKPLNVIAHELLTGKLCEQDGDKWVCLGKFNPYHSGWEIEDVPQYDTDIAAAWRLVEAMRADGAVVQLCASGETGFNLAVVSTLDWDESKLVKRTSNNPFSDASGKTMPLAITTAFVEACKPEGSQ